MKTYTGIINRVGEGVTNGFVKQVSLLEIGQTHIRNVYMTNYISNFIKVGNNVTILVNSGISGGRIFKKAIVGVKIDGKTYKENFLKLLFANVLAIVGYIILIWLIFSMWIGDIFILFYKPELLLGVPFYIATTLSAFVIYRYLKAVVQLIAF